MTTALEHEIVRQINELDKEVNRLRERVAVLETRTTLPPVVGIWPRKQDPYMPPYEVTCGTTWEGIEIMKHYLKVMLLLIAAPFIIGAWMVMNPMAVWKEAKKSWFGERN